MTLNEIFSFIEGERKYIIEFLSNLIQIKAVNPSMGGPGEFKRALYIEDELKKMGISNIRRIDVRDERVKEGVRRNLIAFIPGENRDKTLWIISHTDTVPEGDISLWNTPPFKPVLIGDKLYGRGAEDNGHAIAASILAAKTLIKLNLTPKINFGLMFVADEEAGGRYGMLKIFEENIFRKNDLIIVPDAGTPDGKYIEIAEKSILWFKITTIGKQSHGSMPHKGLNAHRIGMKFSLILDDILHRNFSDIDGLFEPPYSTFEPTKKDKNLDNINTIPGSDIVYFDCRILPKYDLDKVISIIEDTRKLFEKIYNVRIFIEYIAKSQAPPPTSPQSEVVLKLSEAIKKARGIEPKVYGIGGGTFASIFRRRGYQAAVWATIDETAHNPNEYTRISNIIEDAKVFALMALI
ncbi:MAG TPA: M20 family metallo-hydrolase [Thermoprotei archaeon]|nr:M20 family metallo-hydrolase [Thermoprotei archaeon]